MSDDKKEAPYNIEAWHEEWLAGLEQIAMEFMRERFGRGSVDSLVMAADIGEGPSTYECRGALRLPRGTDQVIFKMARCCAADLAPPDELRGCHFRFERFPKASFLLSLLLECGFPKDTRTGMFRGHNGGIILGCPTLADLEDGFGPRIAFHCAFAGLGVLLMRLCRRLIDPDAPDWELIRKTERMYLCVFDGIKIPEGEVKP